MKKKIESCRHWHDKSECVDCILEEKRKRMENDFANFKTISIAYSHLFRGLMADLKADRNITALFHLELRMNEADKYIKLWWRD